MAPGVKVGLPAHCGVIGNEAAGHLAKGGTGNLQADPNPIPNHRAVINIHHNIKNFHQNLRKKSKARGGKI